MRAVIELCWSDICHKDGKTEVKRRKTLLNIMDRITQLIPEPCTAGFWSLQTITCNKVSDVYRPSLPSYGHRSHSRHLLSNKWGVSEGAEKSMEKLYIETSLCGEITALATIDGQPPSHPATPPSTDPYITVVWAQDLHTWLPSCLLLCCTTAPTACR